MDILYIIGDGVSNCEYFDLRCSLRSHALYGKGIGRVFVAGYCPGWLSDEVVRVPFTQPYPVAKNIVEKHINMQETVRFVVENTDISDEFVVSMSDHFLTKPVDFSKYPYCCKLITSGVIIPRIGKGSYMKFISESRKYLEEKGLSVLFTTIHRDMKVSRRSVLACSEMFDEIKENNLPVEPFLLLGNWEYTHGNSKKDIAYYHDYKAMNGSEWWKSSPEVTDIFSTGKVECGIGFYTLLKGMFNKKCRYEI